MYDTDSPHREPGCIDTRVATTGPVITAATTPFGARVAYTDTSTTGTEWFATLPARAIWISQTPSITVELRPLVRLTDDDQHGTYLHRRKVICLPALAEQARNATHQAAKENAGLRTLIASVELRTLWPEATEIVADLAGVLTHENNNPTIEEIRDATGAALWTLDDGPETDTIDRVEEHLGQAMDYLDATNAGWEPLSDTELADWATDTRALSATLGAYYRITLPD